MGKSLSEGQLTKIYEAHNLRMSIEDAARHARVSGATIHKYWKSENLKPHFKKEDPGKARRDVLDLVANEIALHRENSIEKMASNAEIADILDLSIETIPKYLRDLPDNDRDYRSQVQRRESGLNAKINKTGLHAMSLEDRQAIGSRVGKESAKNGTGIHGQTLSDRIDNGKKGGGAAVRNGTGIHALTFKERSENGKRSGAKAAESNRFIEFEGNNYHSKSEAAIGRLLSNYIPGWDIEKGETWQVKDRELKVGGIDFYFPEQGFFLEYHPPLVYSGKNNTGDLKSFKDYKKFMKIKNKIRERKGTQRGMDFQRHIGNIISRKYVKSRECAIEDSGYRGTPLIHAASPEEVYDKIILAYSLEPPKKDLFLAEFRRIRNSLRQSA